MRRMAANPLFLSFAGLIMALPICGLEMLARYRDRTMLEEIYAMTMDTERGRYCYTLSAAEKLYILSESLSSQTFPKAEQALIPEIGQALTAANSGQAEHRSLEEAYILMMSYGEPSDREITNSRICETCNRGLEELKILGILPGFIRPVKRDEYNAVPYSAVNVLEPRNNVAVWKLSLVNSQKNTGKENRLMEAYTDRDNGEAYEFYARPSRLWDDTDSEQIVGMWSSCMELEKPAASEDQNPLMRTTPYFEKYVISQGEEEETIVTVGLYKGINELFPRIFR